jgi:hypothetical protein
MPLPTLPHITVCQEKIDRLGWTHGTTFAAFGLRFGLRSNDAAALTAAAPHAPLGWRSSPMDVVDILYSLRVGPPSTRRGYRNFNLLYCGSALIARSMDLPPLFAAFHRHAELLTALRAQDCVFVHAGVVGWGGRALMIPGRSMSGKTTLVRALVRAGATYYSDEFAVLDGTGHVHPYPVPLSIRGRDGQPGVRTPVESLGGQAGTNPIPLGVIVVTRYQRHARWRPRLLSPAHALLACMDNTVAAQREPQYTMPILRSAVLGARALETARGEADVVARRLLREIVDSHEPLTVR